MLLLLKIVGYVNKKRTGGERGIRTPGTPLWAYTRFPVVLLQPLGHLSAVLIFNCFYLGTTFWRYLLDKIRTFFDENPDCDF